MLWKLGLQHFACRCGVIMICGSSSGLCLINCDHLIIPGACDHDKLCGYDTVLRNRLLVVRQTNFTKTQIIWNTWVECVSLKMLDKLTGSVSLSSFLCH